MCVRRSEVVGVRMFGRADQRTGRPFVGVVVEAPGISHPMALVSIRGIGSVYVDPADLLPVPVGPERAGIVIQAAPGLRAGWRRVCRACWSSVPADHAPGGDPCQDAQDARERNHHE